MRCMQASTDAPGRALVILGIETSCDETAAAVVRGNPPGPAEILSDIVFSQIEDHREYGGVVPEIAARAHVEMLDSVIERALIGAEVALSDIDAIAVTAGPGLIGGVMVGLTTAKALALASGKPLIGINHLEAHALTARLTGGASFPFLLLLVSGGHCQLVAVEAADRFRRYGATIDDAIGEAFDKVAKLLGLPYPGGPAIEVLARRGDSKRLSLPRPLRGRSNCDFSFAGLKTAVRQVVHRGKHRSEDVAASFQMAAIDVVVDRTRNAMCLFRHDFPQQCPTLVAAGGVAANGALRDNLARLCKEEKFDMSVPPRQLCTDNAAMIAWAGVERLSLGLSDELSIAPRARWPLGRDADRSVAQ